MTLAHLGDTRCIKALITDDKKYGKGSLICQKLTEEHRPEHVEEFARITLTGARVQKLVDINGQHKGPYRVWAPNRNTLGLKISRGLGNTVAKACGISSDPSILNTILKPETDYFIILASVGIWDVFDNQELINFIEAHREFCVKGLDVPPNTSEVSYSNACIAQLVCEEARVKWLYKLEYEDTHMDDLTCIILELKLPNGQTEVINDVSLIAENLDELKFNPTRKAPTLKDTIIKESRRISVIGVSMLNSKTEMP